MTWLFVNTLNSEMFNWMVIPLLIGVARVLDVTLGTMRIIFLSRGRRFLAPIFGFFEVLIWLLAIRQIMQNLDNPLSYLAYASGFALGNLIGLGIEGRLAIGTLIVRVIVSQADELASQLRLAGYGVTHMDAHGATGTVQVIYTIIRRKDLSAVIGIINRVHPNSFYSVEEVRMANQGIFPHGAQARHIRWLGDWQKQK